MVAIFQNVFNFNGIKKVYGKIQIGAFIAPIF